VTRCLVVAATVGWVLSGCGTSPETVPAQHTAASRTGTNVRVRSSVATGNHNPCSLFNHSAASSLVGAAMTVEASNPVTHGPNIDCIYDGTRTNDPGGVASSSVSLDLEATDIRFVSPAYWNQIAHTFALQFSTIASLNAPGYYGWVSSATYTTTSTEHCGFVRDGYGFVLSVNGKIPGPAPSQAAMTAACKSIASRA
jgi:hypothetical protein